VPHRSHIPAALAAVAALALAAPAAAGAAPGKQPWTRTIDVNRSAHQLGLPPAAPAERLARTALARNAHRLGLRRGAGLKLAERLRIAGGEGAPASTRLRFHQTAGKLRLVWSQVDVTVAAGSVGSIVATVVPARPGPAAGSAKVTRARALAIAKRAVRGSGSASRPYAVAYAGKPTAARGAKPRRPRRAWVVQVERSGGPTAETQSDLCVVVDAQTGRVIARWPGMASRPDAGADARAAAGGGPAARASSLTNLLSVFDGKLPGRGIYARFDVTGNPRLDSSWPRLSEARFSRPRTVVMDRISLNAENVARTICVRYGYCGNYRVPEPNLASDWNVVGDVPGFTSKAARLSLVVDISHDDVMPANSFNDVVAHEYGHVMDWVYAGDRFVGGSSHQAVEVEEGIADMFAYDYDRGDATFAEESGSGASRDWVNPGRHLCLGTPYPAHMRDYDDTPFPNEPDPHCNSTILSHAYYLLVQRVGPAVAGRLLNTVSATFSPRPTFTEVARGFVARAAQFYRQDGPDPGTDSDIAQLAQASFALVGLNVSLPRDHRTP
jgi:hypothetical protein